MLSTPGSLPSSEADLGSSSIAPVSYGGGRRRLGKRPQLGDLPVTSTTRRVREHPCSTSYQPHYWGRPVSGSLPECDRADPRGGNAGLREATSPRSVFGSRWHEPYRAPPLVHRELLAIVLPLLAHRTQGERYTWRLTGRMGTSRRQALHLSAGGQASDGTPALQIPVTGAKYYSRVGKAVRQDVRQRLRPRRGTQGTG